MTTYKKLRLGIDIGGTFTDFVIEDLDSGTFRTFKRMSTTDNPAEAVLEGLFHVLSIAHSSSESDEAAEPALQIELIHGSTIATNALLERKGATTALVTTRGFRDVLQIGRQNRPVLYDLAADPPPPLVPEQLRFEATERIDHTGHVIQALQIVDVLLGALAKALPDRIPAAS